MPCRPGWFGTPVAASGSPESTCKEQMKSTDMDTAMWRANALDPWEIGKAFPGSSGTTDPCVQKPSNFTFLLQDVYSPQGETSCLWRPPSETSYPSHVLYIIITLGFGGSMLTMHGTLSFLHIGLCVCPFLFPLIPFVSFLRPKPCWMWQTPISDQDDFELEMVFASASPVLGL